MHWMITETAHGEVTIHNGPNGVCKALGGGLSRTEDRNIRATKKTKDQLWAPTCYKQWEVHAGVQTDPR